MVGHDIQPGFRGIDTSQVSSCVCFPGLSVAPLLVLQQHTEIVCKLSLSHHLGRCTYQHQSWSRHYPFASPATTHSSLNLVNNGPFQSIRINGYDTAESSAKGSFHDESCGSFAHSAEVRVQKSFFLHDNLLEIAASLDAHPMVEYSLNRVKGNTTSLTKLVAVAWDRLATSCAFLSEQRVHLCVSRITFHPDRDKYHPRISFLRGQIYSEAWVHLDEYKLTWKDQEEVVFPKVFDIETGYKLGNYYFGPEDPRIIVEDVPGAEPVILFNMISISTGWKRAMWTFRPFTLQTTLLTIDGVERSKVEKNWAPFFLQSPTHERQPSTEIYFVWHFAPLSILKCQLGTGLCQVVFKQEASDELLEAYKSRNASLHGGTQFVPIPRSKPRDRRPSETEIQAFFSIPRHQVKRVGGCVNPSYRPEFATLVTNSTHFYLSYVSSPLDFGPDIVMPAASLEDTCGRGRIMIANSIAQWDLESELPGSVGQTTDVMTLTLSVDDATVQVMRMAGLYDLFNSLPSLSGYFGQNGPESFDVFDTHSFLNTPEKILTPGDMSTFDITSATAWRVRTCVEDEAREYTAMHSKHAPKPDHG